MPIPYDPKLLAVARTLQFNYGQGIWSPQDRYRDLCHILEIPFRLDPIPNYRLLSYPFSFFGKTYQAPDCSRFCLYGTIDEAIRFMDLAPSVKLNWLRNFVKAQELLFNFSESELNFVFMNIIATQGNPNGDDTKLPFEITVSEI